MPYAGPVIGLSRVAGVGPFAALLAAAWLAAGCYIYAPVTPTTPEPGAQIRAEVSDQASADLVSVLGPGVTRINGLVLNREGGMMSVLVNSYFSTRAGDLLSANDPVRIGLDQFRHLEQKRFSTGRSILLGAAFLGGAALVMKITGLDERIFETEDKPPPGSIDRRRFPGSLGWRIRFP